jgi:hypothetical protein
MRRMRCVGVVLLPVVAVVQLEAQQPAGGAGDVQCRAGRGGGERRDDAYPLHAAGGGFRGGSAGGGVDPDPQPAGAARGHSAGRGPPGGSVSIEDLEYPTPGQKEAIWRCRPERPPGGLRALPAGAGRQRSTGAATEDRGGQLGRSAAAGRGAPCAVGLRGAAGGWKRLSRAARRGTGRTARRSSVRRCAWRWCSPWAARKSSRSRCR